MGWVHQSVIFMHVLTGAAFFGLGLRLAGQARTVASVQGDGALLLSRDMGITIRQMSIQLVLTFVFAMAALGLGGGYAGQAQYHVASVLIVALLVLQLWVIRPAWKGLHKAVEEGGERGAFARRLAMASGIGHLVWVVLLMLMFWNRFGVLR